MSNFGVTYLLKINKGNKRLSIEDNIGEELHIHFGELRFMLRNEQFRELAGQALDLISEATDIPIEVLEKIEPIFLFDLCRRGELSSLTLQEIEYVSVGDLLCPVANKYGDWSYKPIRYSHFLQVMKKEVYSTPYDKDQINYLGKTNRERCEDILNECRTNKDICEKYPLYVTGKNIIRDGQHRAAALYYLYGPEFKVKVQRMETSKSFQRNISFTERTERSIRRMIRKPVVWLRNHKDKAQSNPKEYEEYRASINKEPNKEAFESIKNDPELSKKVYFAGPDIALSTFPVLIKKIDADRNSIFKILGKHNLKIRTGHRMENVTFIYGLGEDFLIVDACNKPVAFLQDKVSSYAMSVNSFMPYAPEIQRYLSSFLELPETIEYTLRLLKCMFDKKQKGFYQNDIKYFNDHYYVLEDAFFQRGGLIEKVLFGYAERMMELVHKQLYNEIIDDYRKFEY